MTLITSISGIRGTIGGSPKEHLTPPDIVKYTSAYAHLIQAEFTGQRCKIVLARDARISGEMLHQIVCGTLMACGMDVLDLGLATTPTAEMEVMHQKAHGGIILTASHNPKQWNALKLLNQKGEFISSQQGQKLLELAESMEFTYAGIDALGQYHRVENALKRHIEAIINLPYVNRDSIRKAGFKIVIDPVNSVGATAVPELLKALGINEFKLIHDTVNGEFAHNPEPLPEHLTDLSDSVINSGAHLGISVDPDVDRLAFVCEDGSLFGEEYTLVAVADFMLRHFPGTATVSNLSSTRALADITLKSGSSYSASAVGEVNVVETMKRTGAKIGGEGNGGVIVSDLHYGRDALAGIALFLSWLSDLKRPLSEAKKLLPAYSMSKQKVDVHSGIVLEDILKSISNQFKNEPQNTSDGLKIDFKDAWVHLRKSNTEPIIRIYTEAKESKQADALAQEFADRIRKAAELT